MIELPINRDPQDINKSVYSGKKPWQYICICAAFILVIIFTVVVKLNPTINSIICAVIVCPLGYVAFFNRKGYDFFKYRRLKKRMEKGRSLYLYNNLSPYKADDEKAKKTPENILLRIILGR